MLEDISWLAVLVGAIAQMGLGMLWYHPSVFGHTWATSLGFKMEMMEPKLADFAAAAIVAFITSLTMALFVDWTDSQTSLSGAGLGFSAGLGFVVTRLYSQVIWAKRPLVAFLIDSGNSLATLTLVGSLIGMLTD